MGDERDKMLQALYDMRQLIDAKPQQAGDCYDDILSEFPEEEQEAITSFLQQFQTKMGKPNTGFTPDKPKQPKKKTVVYAGMFYFPCCLLLPSYY
jgi:hypothetical protein